MGATLAHLVVVTINLTRMDGSICRASIDWSKISAFNKTMAACRQSFPVDGLPGDVYVQVISVPEIAEPMAYFLPSTTLAPHCSTLEIARRIIASNNGQIPSSRIRVQSSQNDLGGVAIDSIRILADARNKPNCECAPDGWHPTIVDATRQTTASHAIAVDECGNMMCDVGVFVTGFS
jgi:hypothetical protein